MAEVIFKYNEIENIIILCDIYGKMNDICKRFSSIINKSIKFILLYI